MENSTTPETKTTPFIKVPLKNLRFIDPIEQMKFEERIKNEQGLPQLISEIEGVIYDRLLEMVI